MRGKDFWYFVLGLIVLYAFGRVIYDQATGNDAASVARREKEAADVRAKAEAERVAFEREDGRRSFALKESPVLWTTIEDLKAKIEAQNGKLKKLKKTFEDLSMNPQEDKDYVALIHERDQMVKRLCEVDRELDQAYLESVKYEVTRGKAEKEEFERKATDDGCREAMQSRSKYEELRKEK